MWVKPGIPIPVEIAPYPTLVGYPRVCGHTRTHVAYYAPIHIVGPTYNIK